MSAAAPISGEVALQMYESLEQQGVKDFSIRQGFGMTELSPVGSVVRYRAGDLNSFSSIGEPVMSTQVGAL